MTKINRVELYRYRSGRTVAWFTRTDGARVYQNVSDVNTMRLQWVMGHMLDKFIFRPHRPYYLLGWIAERQKGAGV